MLKLIAEKIIYLFVSLIIVVTFTFLLLKMLPGDPFQQEQALPDEIHTALRQYYGLNASWPEQYVKYLKEMLHFNFGSSLVHKGRSVNEIIMESFPTSALLGSAALVIAIPLGFILGIIAALKVHRTQDVLVSIFAIIGISLPSFVLATLLQYTFGIKLGILPIARFNSFSHIVMPAITLAALPAAFIARMMRAKILEELSQGYVTTAKAKGLSQLTIIKRHVLRNSVLPLFGYIGSMTASVITGSFIIEKIFAIPGLGYWFVTSVSNRDYPLIMGITVFYCALLLITSLLVDLATLWIDPRIARRVHNNS